MKYSNDVAMTWRMKWLNRSITTINATLQLLDIYRLYAHKEGLQQVAHTSPFSFGSPANHGHNLLKTATLLVLQLNNQLEKKLITNHITPILKKVRLRKIKQN